MRSKRPNDAFVVHALGMEHLGQQDVVNAVQYFHKAIEIQGDYTASYYKLTECYMLLDNWSEAKQYADRGYEIAEQANDGKSMLEFEDLLDQIEDHEE